MYVSTHWTLTFATTVWVNVACAHLNCRENCTFAPQNAIKNLYTNGILVGATTN